MIKPEAISPHDMPEFLTMSRLKVQAHKLSHRPSTWHILIHQGTPVGIVCAHSQSPIPPQWPIVETFQPPVVMSLTSLRRHTGKFLSYLETHRSVFVTIRQSVRLVVYPAGQDAVMYHNPRIYFDDRGNVQENRTPKTSTTRA